MAGKGGKGLLAAKTTASAAAASKDKDKKRPTSRSSRAVFSSIILVEAAEYIQDAISKWPQLRPLCLIMKDFLQQRELNEVYSGGIGSYAFLAMLIAMLRNSIDTHASPEYNLGVFLVLNLFSFISINFLFLFLF
ncbi:hypothetical protein LXL04_007035 [Taraxacum kok-saghyz]